MPIDFPATRAAALTRLAAFTPHMGHAYAAGRNTDLGPDAASTSRLSPYLRRRMLTEYEVVDAARGAYKEGAEKFIQEVFWRTYFKGHLETRPQIWTAYRALVADGEAALAAGAALQRRFTQAVEGRTGIEGFDDWAQELVANNWLHNHARMWFASIWIFTLRLPWALGADFFLRHLIDADPASNTLSWRWVAGLHTRGKPYAARAENISRYTNGRFNPTGLNEAPEALEEPEPRPATPLAKADTAPAGDIAVLLHLDDLHPESLDLGRARVVLVGGLLAHAPGTVETVKRFDCDAMADALAHAAAHFGCSATMATPGWSGDLPVVTAWAPVGPSAESLPPAIRVRRAWDTSVWPRSTRGYFQVKAAIPSVLASLARAPNP